MKNVLRSTTNKMKRFSNLFISVRRSTCFRRFFRSSSGAQNWKLYVQFCAPDDGRKNRLKHVERLTEINKFEKRCVLMVVLCDYINHARTYEC